jgi:hypothetical protein
MQKKCPIRAELRQELGSIALPQWLWDFVCNGCGHVQRLKLVLG